MFAGGDNSFEPLYDNDFVVDATSNTLTIAGASVVTSASLSVHPDDPAQINNTASGIEFEFIGGTWDFPTTLTLNASVAATTTPLPPDTFDPPSTYTLPAAPLIIVCGYDAFTTTNTAEGFLETFSGGDWPGVDFKSQFNDVITARISEGQFIVYPDDDNFMSSYGSSFGVVGSGTIQHQLTVTTGPVTVSASTFSAPQVITIASIPGGLAAEYVGCNTDLHVGDGSYLANGCVVGRGAQDHSHDGSLWLETQGDYQSPTTGSQETRIYTSQQGTHFVNKLHAANEGSTNSAFMFDWDIMTSGSLESSATLNIGGSYEGVATVASGGTSITISSSVVTSSDTIPLSYPSGSNSGGAPWIESITSGTNFVINTTGAVTTDTLINWKLLR